MFVSCRHDVEIKKNEPLRCLPDNYVIAGTMNKCMVYRDLIPDIDSNIHTLNVNDTGPDMVVDLNNDLVNDISFYMYSVSGANTFITVKPLNTASDKICINTSNIVYGLVWVGPKVEDSVAYCYGNTIQYSLNDTIRLNKGLWSPLATSYISGSYTYPLKNDNFNFLNNIWNPSFHDKYLGFRFIQENDTLYGWMRYSVVYPHFILHDCAYQQTH